MKRIAIAGFQHETNTFAPTLANFHEFEIADAWPGLLTGDNVISDTAGINLPITGFVDAAITAGEYDLIPIIWCAAEPSSYVTSDAYEKVVEIILKDISNTPQLDGIYLDLHGAMVTQGYEDGEGELLRRIRGIVGYDFPISVSLDLHANITPELVEYASSINIFRTYPHIDMAETGRRAFKSLERLFSHGPFQKSYRQLPFLVPLPAQYTGWEPCKSLYASLDKIVENSVFSADIAMGFPPADIFHSGSSVIAYARNKVDADYATEQLFVSFLNAEGTFQTELQSPRSAVAEAMSNKGPRPVVIADVQDNAGAGASSDTTGMLVALIEENAQSAALGILDDRQIANKAHKLGVDAEFEAFLGGKSGQVGQTPFQGRFKVESLSNGEFSFTGAMYGGNIANLGQTAVLRVLDTSADVLVIVGSTRCQCLDQSIFTHIGIDPKALSIIVVKSSVHFRADFEPITDDILLAEAPGAHPCRLDKITYHNLRPGVRLGPHGAPYTG